MLNPFPIVNSFDSLNEVETFIIPILQGGRSRFREATEYSYGIRIFPWVSQALELNSQYSIMGPGKENTTFFCASEACFVLKGL